MLRFDEELRWTQPRSLGGELLTDPGVCSWGPGQLDAFDIDTRQRLVHWARRRRLRVDEIRDGVSADRAQLYNV
jgi:hypothetical protein